MFFPYKDDNPRILVPVVTYGIIAANVLIFLYQFTLAMSGPESEARFIYMFGLIPAQFHIINLFTSMFLHGGIAHILGNMWFLWIFGDNIEDSMGHLRFLAFFILTGLIAVGAHVFLSPDSSIPMVGASGAISGIMGAYFIQYPKARIKTLVVFGWFHVWRIPAWIFLGIWTGMQFLGLGAAATGDGGGIAYAAHLGGLFAGLGLVFLFRKTKPANAWI